MKPCKKIPVNFGFYAHSPEKLTMVPLVHPSPLSAAKAGCSVAVCHSVCGLCQSQKPHFPPPPRESEECQFLFAQPWPLRWHTGHVLTAGHALTAAAGQVGSGSPRALTEFFFFYCYFSIIKVTPFWDNESKKVTILLTQQLLLWHVRKLPGLASKSC